MVDDQDVLIVTESSTTIKYKVSDKYLNYNATKQLSTDLSISFINFYISELRGHGIKKPRNSISLLNLYTGNAVKVIRYYQEISALDSVTSVDQSQGSIELAKENLEFNNLSTDTVQFIQDSIPSFLKNLSMYNVIELDHPKRNFPEIYDHMIQKITTPGLLILNLPELGLISGNAYHDKCFQTYGGYKMGKHSDTIESGVRLVLHKLDQVAMSHSRQIHVLLTFVQKNCIKIFIRVNKQNDKQSNSSNCYYCPRCDFFCFEQKDCDHCKTYTIKSGPFWSSPINDKDFLNSFIPVRESYDKINNIIKELDQPIFAINPNKWFKSSKQKPIREIILEITKVGYSASTTQFGSSLIRTNCPWNELDKILQKKS